MRNMSRKTELRYSVPATCQQRVSNCLDLFTVIVRFSSQRLSGPHHSDYQALITATVSAYHNHYQVLITATDRS